MTELGDLLEGIAADAGERESEEPAATVHLMHWRRCQFSGPQCVPSCTCGCQEHEPGHWLASADNGPTHSQTALACIPGEGGSRVVTLTVGKWNRVRRPGAAVGSSRRRKPPRGPLE